MALVTKALSVAKIMPQIMYQIILAGVLATTVFFLRDVGNKLQKNIINLFSTIALTT